MIKEAIDKLVKNENLNESQMMEVMGEIMEGKTTSAQIGSFLTALRIKGETIEEIIGSAKVMRDKSLQVKINKGYAIDTCGTGGDRANTFNISTIVAFIACACGVTVVKHGNRSISSKCGSADVLELLGVNIDLNTSEVKRCVKEIDIGFMFAPNFHKAMKHVIMPRRELGIRTIFNILGPLTSPARVNGQVLGVFDEKLTEVLALALKELEVERAMVVHGLDGLDEITTTTKTKITELKNNVINTYYIDPMDFNIPLGKKEELLGGEARKNADIMLKILTGEKSVKRNIVLLNAGAAIYVGKQANSIEEGIDKAKEVLDNGLALKKLNQLVTLSQEMKK